MTCAKVNLKYQKIQMNEMCNAMEIKMESENGMRLKFSNYHCIWWDPFKLVRGKANIITNVNRNKFIEHILIKSMYVCSFVLFVCLLALNALFMLTIKMSAGLLSQIFAVVTTIPYLFDTYVVE